MKIQKRHVVLAALIVALGTAVYLNWHFSDTGSLISPSSKELGAATYVNADASSTADEAQSVSKTLSKEESYFAQALTEREKAQDRVMSEAKKVLELAESSDEAKAEAAKQVSTVEDRILAQSNIENILKGKGFSRCLCFLSDEGCTVSVIKAELKTISPLVVKDVVTSQADVAFNNITVVDV